MEWWRYFLVSGFWVTFVQPINGITHNGALYCVIISFATMKQLKNVLQSFSRLVLWVVVLLLVAACRFISDMLAIVRIIINALDRAPRYAAEQLMKRLDV